MSQILSQLKNDPKMFRMFKTKLNSMSESEKSVFLNEFTTLENDLRKMVPRTCSPDIVTITINEPVTITILTTITVINPEENLIN
jgi:hypothetical protein